MERKLDEKKSKELCERYGTQVSMCFNNAFTIAAIEKKYVYVEGWVTSNKFKGFAFLHGWLESPDGQTVYDVTPNTLAHVSDGEGITADNYFPGPRWTHDECVHIFMHDAGDDGLSLPITNHRKQKDARVTLLDAECAAHESVMPGYTAWRKSMSPKEA